MLLIKTEVFEVFNHFIQTNPINTELLNLIINFN